MEKKVAFFHPYFDYGGVEKTNLRIAKYLIRCGYRVDFIALSFSERLKTEIEELGIRQISLTTKRTFGAIPELRSYINEQRKSYILTFISCQNYANLVSIFSWPQNREGIKLIVSERSQVDEFKYQGKALKAKVIAWLMRHYYKRADVILANSMQMRDELTRNVKKEVRCIYNPTLSENYELMASMDVDKEWFRENKPIIISVGRLTFPKGFHTLIKAFNIVQKKIDSRLVILGEGTERQALENLVTELGLNEKVWMPGYEKNPYRFLKKSDVFVLASLYEGLPNVLIEALALGVPCVSTNCKSGPSEILLEGKGGYLTQVENEYEMADAIIMTLEDKKRTKEMLDMARSMLYRFTSEEVGKQYVEVIEE